MRSVTSLRKSSAARACMRAGISSEKSSSRRSGMDQRDRSEILMAAVAHRLVGGAFAGAEPGLFGGGRLVLDRREARAFVRAVAERLRLRTPAGAPPVALAGLDVDRDWPPSADFGHIVHPIFPPPCVASHASPQ